MSLKVWLPLNGDIKNYGASNLTFTNNGPDNIVPNTSGKIGSCYKRATVNSLGRIISNENILLDGDFSMCCWAYVTATVGSTANGLVSNHDHTYSSGAGINVKQISDSDYRICCSTGYGSGRTFDTYYGTTNIKNSWHHLTLTYRKTAQTLLLYCDGVLEKTVTGYNNSARSSQIMVFDWSIPYTSNNFKPACSLNDVRIYDECLSPDEVKEISKALVAYYPLNQPSRNANLISSFSAGRNISIENNNVIIKAQSTVSDTYFTIRLNEALLANTTYTLSCKIKNMNCSTSWFFPLFAQGNPISKQLEIYNNKPTTSVSFSLPTGSSYVGATTIFMDDLGRPSSNPNDITLYNFKLEKGDVATPWYPPIDSARLDLIEYDNSGYNRNGATTDSTKPSLVVDSPRNSGSYHFSANTQNLSLNTSFLPTFTAGTVSWWAKIVQNGTTGTLPFTGHELGYWIAASSGWTGAFYSQGISGSGYTIKYYIDGVEDTTPSGADSKWHHYMVTGVNLSKWTKLWLNNYDAAWNSPNIYYSDIKFYNTVLSAEDVSKEYHRFAAIYSDHSLATNEVQEYTGNNLIQKANNGIANKSYTGALSSYTQSNCQVSLTDNGYRIYRPANKTPSADGNTMWGGLVIRPYNENNTDVFIKGHTYILKWHVKGKSSNSADFGWSNNVGWGGGGLMPSPSNDSWQNISTNFNGEMECWYKWTINDDVYKVCTSSYSSFVQGQTYLSYRDFKFGFSYTDTGSLGTDLYITNVRLYDITNDNQKVKIGVNGVINGNIVEGNFDNVSMLPDGEFYTTQFIERI